MYEKFKLLCHKMSTIAILCLFVVIFTAYTIVYSIYYIKWTVYIALQLLQFISIMSTSVEFTDIKHSTINCTAAENSKG